MANFVTELQAKMASYAGVVYCNDEDEIRLMQKCRQAAMAERYSVWRWTATDGLVPISDDIVKGLREQNLTDNEIELKKTEWAGLVSPAAFLTAIKQWSQGPSVVLAHDLFTLANRTGVTPLCSRLIKDITALQQQADDRKSVAGVCQLIINDPQEPDVDTPLQRLTVELPSRREMGLILDTILKVEEPEVREAAQQHYERILNSLMGMSALQASNAIMESLSRTGRIDADLVKSYKKEFVATRGLTWIEPEPRGFDAVGGLEPAKQWAMKRAVAFNAELRAKYGTRAPKGMLAGGLPGCAKSMFAKCLASAWGGMVLLRLDVSETRGKFVGESESQLQLAIKTAEAAAPAILWIDEIDKQFAQTSSESDGGIGARTLGYLLTWMQEKGGNADERPVVVYGAGNRMDVLPSEFMRAGRFDRSIWFDLPSQEERLAIVKVYEQQYPMKDDLDVDRLVKASDRCSGAEIEACFHEAALTAMTEDRKMTTDDVELEMRQVTKVADTFELSDGLKKWRDAALRANNQEPQSIPSSAPTSVRRRRRPKQPT